MPPKDSKKGGKQILLLSQLTALQATYKAASRRYGVPPVKAISELLETSIQDQANINKLSLQGPDMQWQQLAALLDCMAGYPAVKNLCCWSCNVGDEGLIRIAQLLRSSAADRWWRGSKLKHLELCGDGQGLRPDKWNERYLTHVNGGLATEGPGFQLPSLVLGQGLEDQRPGSVKSVVGVTPDTLKLSDQLSLERVGESVGMGGQYKGQYGYEVQRELEAQLRAQAVQQQPTAVEAGGTAVGAVGTGGGAVGGEDGEAGMGEAVDVLREAEEREEEADAEAAGEVAAAAAQALQAVRLTVRVDEGEGEDWGGANAWSRAGSARGGDGGGAGGGGPTSLLHNVDISRVRPGHLLRSLPPVPPATSGTVAGDTIAATTVRSSLQEGFGTAGASPLASLEQRLLTERRVSPLEAASAGHLLTSAMYQAQDQARSREREWEHESRRQAGLPPLAGAPEEARGRSGAAPASTSQATSLACPSLPSFAQPPPLAFSPPALKELSLGLSVLGLTLQVLALDHNHLGNVGARILAQGLKRCLSLQHLSLENCGVGPVGAEALAETMAPQADETPELAALRPKLIALNLSRNPLGGTGLAALSLGLRHCATLRILNLCSIDVGPEDLPALRCLLLALEARPAIEQVDLDSNYIGDSGILVFLPFLSQAKQMRKFRVALRGLSPPVGQAVTALLRANHPKKKKKAVARKKK